MVNPNTTYQVLHNVVQVAKNKHVPSKLVKFDKYKHKKTKWITSGIIKSIQYKDNLNKILKMTYHGSTQFATYKLNLDTYNNILKRSIHLAKQNYYLTIFTKFKDDIRGTWKAINEILSKTKRKKHFPLYFKDGDNILTNKDLISNKFNSFFTNIGPTLSNQINIPQNKTFKSFLTEKHNINFSFQSIDEETVCHD